MAETDPQVLQVPQVPQVWQVPQDHLGYQEHQVVTDVTVEEVFLDPKEMLALAGRQVFEDLLDPKGKRDKKDRGCLE